MTPIKRVSRETTVLAEAAFHVKQDPLERFLNLVAEAPQRLVGDTSYEALAAHVADAISSLYLLEQESGPLLDAGSGAGFPGIPIFLARSDLHGALLDSRARRCSHLEEAVATTGLSGRVEVLNLRVEAYARSSGREAYGIVVARALASPPIALELCLPLVRVGGIALLHTGDVDRFALDTVAGELGGTVEQIAAVPGFDRRTHVVVRKVTVTPEQFPRRVSHAVRNPLVRPAL